jgi:tripartite-type tricarboxylate transporter receptor subunit TctC
VAVVNPLLTRRILPTLLRLSLPNLISMIATTLVAIAETVYVGMLGLPQLAGIALVFPMVMLQQMMSAGAMGGAHLAFTAVAKKTGGKLQHVPFNGAAAATAAVLGNHVNVALVPAYRDLVRDNKLRLLAVLDGTRDPDFPDVPTLKDAGFDIEFPSIVGILAPAKADPSVTAKLEKVFTDVASSKDFKDFMTKLSQPVRIMSGKELGKTIAGNLQAYRELAKEMGQTK